MFWGCFSGLINKKPGLFQKKNQKTINKKSYIKYTVPVIEAFIYDNPGLFLIQDHAPGHVIKYTIDKLESRNIQLIFWSLYSPDLNPIKTVQNIIKNWIQINYLEDKLSYKILRKAVIDSWKTI